MYYKVLAKCGHVKRNNYILKWFYIEAQSAKVAAKEIRFKGRVKHNHKDAIKEVVKIDFDEYTNGLKMMGCDDYFRIYDSSMQKVYNCAHYSEIYPENEKAKYLKKKKRPKTKIFGYGKRI